MLLRLNMLTGVRHKCQLTPASSQLERGTIKAFEVFT